MKGRAAVIRSDRKHIFGITERRKTPRIREPFPIAVYGTSVSGVRREVTADVENLCARGIYFRSFENIESWKRILVVVRLSLSADRTVPAATFAARAQVLRVEPRNDGRTGFAVSFARYRFL